MPSHISFVEPFAPEWPSWQPIAAEVFACTKSTARFQPSRCSSVHRPPQPGLIRPIADGQIISVITRPAPPSALPPRCTRWNSVGTPSSATYMSIGETITRLFRVRPGPSVARRVTGWNIGGVSGLDSSLPDGSTDELLGEPGLAAGDELRVAHAAGCRR